ASFCPRYADDRAAPVERLVLRVSFSQLKRDLGLGQLGPEIEGVRAVGLDPELVEQRKRIPGDEMAGAIVDVNSVLGRLDPVIVVLHLRRTLSDFSAR